jgi:hypothetical protein
VGLVESRGLRLNRPCFTPRGHQVNDLRLSIPEKDLSIIGIPNSGKTGEIGENITGPRINCMCTRKPVIPQLEPSAHHLTVIMTINVVAAVSLHLILLPELRQHFVELAPGFRGITRDLLDDLLLENLE